MLSYRPIAARAEITPFKKIHFLHYINNFRGFSILLIMLGHCIDPFEWENNIYIYNIMISIFKGGSIYFIFISGFLFQHLSTNFTFTNYMAAKIKHIILPYIISSVPALIFFTVFARKPLLPTSFYEQSHVYQILYFLITGSHLKTLWFIPMMFIFYAVSPLLHYYDKRNILYYLFPIFFIFSICPPHGPPAISNFLHFLIIYVAGMFCSKHKDIFFKLSFPLISSIISFTISILFIVILNYTTINTEYSLFCRLITCLFLLNLFYHTESSRLLRLLRIDYFAAMSFALYFIHPYLISTIRYLYSGTIGGVISTSPTIILYIVFFLLILIFSTLLIESIRRYFGKYSRYLIGV